MRAGGRWADFLEALPKFERGWREDGAADSEPMECQGLAIAVTERHHQPLVLRRLSMNPIAPSPSRSAEDGSGII